MKQTMHVKRLLGKLLLLGFLASVSTAIFAQGRSEIVDLKLDGIQLSDLAGNPVDINNLYLDQVLKMKLAVKAESHGYDIPVGSCKLKIGFGSKLQLDPQLNLSDIDAARYFRWTSSANDGQVMLSGELMAALPANVQELVLYVRLKSGGEAGASTITANLLITNHSTTTVVSDENGANNAASLKYVVSDKKAPVQPQGELELAIYPNPVRDAQVTIAATSGSFTGKYRLTLTDAAGKTVSAREVDLVSAKTVTYPVPGIASGKYLVSVQELSTAKNFVLRFEKL